MKSRRKEYSGASRIANESSGGQKVRTTQIPYGLISHIWELGLYSKCNEELLKRKITPLPLGRTDLRRTRLEDLKST